MKRCREGSPDLIAARVTSEQVHYELDQGSSPECVRAFAGAEGGAREFREDCGAGTMDCISSFLCQGVPGSCASSRAYELSVYIERCRSGSGSVSSTRGMAWSADSHDAFLDPATILGWV